jgi:hypothetical protein
MAKDNHCPLLKKACIESRCKWWVHIRGKHPQSNAELDMPDCAVKWLPVLMIEMSQMERQTGAAVESFRNEHVESTKAMAEGLLAVAHEAKERRLLGSG